MRFCTVSIACRVSLRSSNNVRANSAHVIYARRHATTHVNRLETGTGETGFIHAFEKAGRLRMLGHDFGNQFLVTADGKTPEMFDNKFTHGPSNYPAKTPTLETGFSSPGRIAGVFR